MVFSGHRYYKLTERHQVFRGPTSRSMDKHWRTSHPDRRCGSRLHASSWAGCGGRSRGRRNTRPHDVSGRICDGPYAIPEDLGEASPGSTGAGQAADRHQWETEIPGSSAGAEPEGMDYVGQLQVVGSHGQVGMALWIQCRRYLKSLLDCRESFEGLPVVYFVSGFSAEECK